MVWSGNLLIAHYKGIIFNVLEASEFSILDRNVRYVIKHWGVEIHSAILIAYFIILGIILDWVLLCSGFGGMIIWIYVIIIRVWVWRLYLYWLLLDAVVVLVGILVRGAVLVLLRAVGIAGVTVVAARVALVAVGVRALSGLGLRLRLLLRGLLLGQQVLQLLAHHLAILDRDLVYEFVHLFTVWTLHEYILGENLDFISRHIGSCVKLVACIYSFFDETVEFFITVVGGIGLAFRKNCIFTILFYDATPGCVRLNVFKNLHLEIISIDVEFPIWLIIICKGGLLSKSWDGCILIEVAAEWLGLRHDDLWWVLGCLFHGSEVFCSLNLLWWVVAIERRVIVKAVESSKCLIVYGLVVIEDLSEG